MARSQQLMSDWSVVVDAEVLLPSSRLTARATQTRSKQEARTANGNRCGGVHTLASFSHTQNVQCCTKRTASIYGSHNLVPLATSLALGAAVAAL